MCVRDRDWTMDDPPVWLKTRKGRILSIPYPIEVNDTRGIIWYHHTSQEFADMITDQFDEMLAQSERQPLVCPISLHPFVFGRPYRIRRLRRALQHLSLIHISEPTRQAEISYAVFCL